MASPSAAVLFLLQCSTTNSGDARAMLSWFLEMATGFYFLLLHKIRSKYDLDLPFLRSGESDPFRLRPGVCSLCTRKHYGFSATQN